MLSTLDRENRHAVRGFRYRDPGLAAGGLSTFSIRSGAPGTPSRWWLAAKGADEGAGEWTPRRSYVWEAVAPQGDGSEESGDGR